MTYAKIISETTIDRNPPRRATINGREVTGELPADYLATLGYLPFDETPVPSVEPAQGKHWESRYAEAEGRVAQSWTQVDDPAPTLADFDAAMEDHLRTEREARGYTTREPSDYLASANPRWAQDARDWVAHRDAVMEYAQEIMNEVKAGTREPPTLEDFKAGLPQIVWSVIAE